MQAATPRMQEELRVAADQLVGTVRELVHEGNVRRVIVRNDAGQMLLEIPLTLGVVGALVLPVAAALGALAAVASGLVIVVERAETSPARGRRTRRGAPDRGPGGGRRRSRLRPPSGPRKGAVLPQIHTALRRTVAP